MWRQKVFLNRRSSYVATTAFFSSRLVKAGEELTWDYGYERWEQNADYSDEAEFMDCLCGSFRCKNRLMIRGVNLGED
jgi:SET domain-containing protein